MSYVNVKSPVTYLYELCLKRGITPLFEHENSAGPVHQRTFNVKVTVGEFVANGSATSKKKAKHLAAIDILTQMTQTSNESESNSSSAPNTSGAEVLSFRLQNNPVGELQELTQKRQLPLPIYEFVMTPGPPDVRVFTCTVRLLKFTENGVGKSKKIAKRIAATALLNQLQVDDLANQLDEALKNFKEDFNISKSDIRSAYQSLKTSNQNGPEVYDGNRHAMTYCGLLQELANEHKFEVTYADLPELTSTGFSQCIVQLSTMPVAVCHGSGQSSEEAHDRAAFNSILYLGNIF